MNFKEFHISVTTGSTVTMFTLQGRERDIVKIAVEAAFGEADYITIVELN